MKSIFLSFALGWLSLPSLSWAAPLNSSHLALQDAKNPNPIPIRRYTFEELWYNGLERLYIDHPLAQSYEFMVQPTNHASADVKDFSIVTILVYDPQFHCLLRTTNIGSSTLWGPIQVESAPSTESTLETWSERQLVLTLADAFRILYQSGYRQVWDSVIVIVSRDERVPLRYEPIYWFKRAYPTEEFHSVIVSARSGEVRFVHSESDVAAGFPQLNSNGTGNATAILPATIMPVSAE